jgi:hypothetical protein
MANIAQSANNRYISNLEHTMCSYIGCIDESMAMNNEVDICLVIGPHYDRMMNLINKIKDGLIGDYNYSTNRVNLIIINNESYKNTTNAFTVSKALNYPYIKYKIDHELYDKISIFDADIYIDQNDMSLLIGDYGYNISLLTTAYEEHHSNPNGEYDMDSSINHVVVGMKISDHGCASMGCATINDRKMMKKLLKWESTHTHSTCWDDFLYYNDLPEYSKIANMNIHMIVSSGNSYEYNTDEDYMKIVNRNLNENNDGKVTFKDNRINIYYTDNKMIKKIYTVWEE